MMWCKDWLLPVLQSLADSACQYLFPIMISSPKATLSFVSWLYFQLHPIMVSGVRYLLCGMSLYMDAYVWKYWKYCCSTKFLAMLQQTEHDYINSASNNTHNLPWDWMHSFIGSISINQIHLFTWKHILYIITQRVPVKKCGLTHILP